MRKEWLKSQLQVTIFVNVITNYGWNDYWFTNKEEKSWVRFDFKTRRVYLKSYSLKSDGIAISIRFETLWLKSSP